MPAPDTARKVTRTAKKSTTTVAATAKGSARRSADTVKESAAKAAKTTKRAVGGARASRAAKAGMVEDARQVAAEADAYGSAADAIAEAEAMHYQVEVNKRGLSVKALTKTLNARWDNGWRLAHMLEQRGNTVLVFEKRA